MVLPVLFENQVKAVIEFAAPKLPMRAARQGMLNLLELSAMVQGPLSQWGAAAHATGVRARVHLKVDTGLSRNGAVGDDWVALVEASRSAELAGLVSVVGIWSHFACADTPEHPSVQAALRVSGVKPSGPLVSPLQKSV